MFFELRVTGLGNNVFCHLAPRDSKREYRADPMASQESEVSLEDDARNEDGEILFAELTGEESAWTIELSKDGLNPGISLDSEANLSFPQRVKNWFEQAQSVAPKGDTQFELELSSHGTLSVIRQTKKGIQLQLAEFQAVEVSAAERLRFTQKLLLLCTAEIHTLNTHVEVAKTKIEKVKRAHDTISEAMVKSARNERKQRDEMITKFGLVLNEKKDQLRRYQEEALQADKDSDSDDAKSNASRSFNVLSDEESTSSQAQEGPYESKLLPKTKRKERALSPHKKVPPPTRRAVKSQSRSAKESQDLSVAKQSVSSPSARTTKPVPQPPSTKTEVRSTKPKEQKEKYPQQVPPYFSLDKSRRDPTRTVFDYYKKVGLVNDPSQFKEVVSRYASLPKWAALPGVEGNPEEIRAFLRKHEGEEIFQLAHGETYSKLSQKRLRGHAIDPKPLTETKRQRAVNETTRVQHVSHDAKKPAKHEVEPELKPTVAPKKIAQVIQNNAEDSDSSSEDDFPL